MDVKRTVLLGVLGGAVAVWIASAATTTRPVVQPATAPRTRIVEMSGAELSAEIARLHDRLRPDAVPMQNRDVFRYSSRTTAAARTQATAVDVPVAAPVLPPPPFKLVGMADDVAIIAGAGDLLFVREGDAVTARYRVTRVSSDSVDLQDVNDQSPIHLALK